MTLKHIGMRSFRRKSFIVLKKLYRFSCIGKTPLINTTRDFMIGVYKGHKIGLFNYSYVGPNNSTVIIISMNNCLPKFLLRPKSMAYRIFNWKKNKLEIKTPLKRFSDSMVLLAKDKDKFKIAMIFNYDVLNYFACNKQLWVESDGYNLLIFNQNERLYNGDLLDDMLDRAIDIKKKLGADKCEISNSQSFDNATNKDLA
jgi:hypothetical protein